MRLGGIVVAVCLLAAACSAEAPPAPTPTPTPPPTSDAPNLGPGPESTPVTTPQPPPPASPAEVTSACPFLGVDDINQAIGVDWDGRAVEAKPDQRTKPTRYRCDYPSATRDTTAYNLQVAAFPGTTRPDTALRGFTADCTGPLTTVGPEARLCELPDREDNGPTQHVVRLFVTKAAHAQTRVAVLELQATRLDVYPALATLLLERL